MRPRDRVFAGLRVLEEHDVQGLLEAFSIDKLCGTLSSYISAHDDAAGDLLISSQRKDRTVGKTVPGVGAVGLPTH